MRNRARTRSLVRHLPDPVLREKMSLQGTIHSLPMAKTLSTFAKNICTSSFRHSAEDSHRSALFDALRQHVQTQTSRTRIRQRLQSSRSAARVGRARHVRCCFADETQFRQMVVWLEDMKIRLYPIDGRQALRDTQNQQWDQAFVKVRRTAHRRNERWALVLARSQMSVR